MSDESGNESSGSGWCLVSHEDIVNEDDDQRVCKELNVEASDSIKDENNMIGENVSETTESSTESRSAKSSESEAASDVAKQSESVRDDHKSNLMQAEADPSAVKAESVALENDSLSALDKGTSEQGASATEAKSTTREIETKPEICNTSDKPSVISGTPLTHTERSPESQKTRKFGRVASKQRLHTLWRDLPVTPSSSESSSNTDSSSDVDILDESVEITDVDLRSNPMLDSTLRLSAQSFLRERITSSTQAIPDTVTRETQASLASETTFRRPNERPATNTRWIDRKGILQMIIRSIFNPENQPLLFALLMSWFFILTLLVVLLLNIAAVWFLIGPLQLDKPLTAMHKTMVQCLGEQHLAYLANGGDASHDPLVCKHNAEHYNAAMFEDLNWRSRHFLLRIVDNPEDPYVLSYAMDHKDFHLIALVRQLQYFELLPTKEVVKDQDVDKTKETSQAKVKVKEVPDPIREMKDVIANLTLANRILKEQVIESALYNKNDDLIIAKDGLPSIESNHDGQSHGNNLVRDLKTKITWLLVENGKLEKKIHDMRVAQLKGHCTDASQKIVPDISASSQEKSSNKSSSKDDGAEKIKPYLDELVSSLSGQILNLHSSLSNELKEVKRWNELIQNMTMELRNRSSAQRDESEKWSWQEIRESVENIVLDTHKDIKERISAFQTIDITDTFHNVVEDNKKNAEYMLNLVNHYFNAAKEKTQELLETQMPDINTEAPVEGFWNVMGSLKDKWHYVKGEFKRMAKDLQMRQRCQDSHTCGTAEDEVNWYFKKPSKRGDDINFDDHDDSRENWYLKRLRRHRSFPESPYYEKRVKSDWLFKRAAHRAKRRHELEKKIRAGHKRHL